MGPQCGVDLRVYSRQPVYTVKPRILG